ncbi:hypothetical protein V1477_007294 [Vespula maculifrons]|uniref:Uncharacterized protein n=1 Tax=Vespula maculifrons TaxID=7453 RepID=A0ABD2CI60_VESMC
MILLRNSFKNRWMKPLQASILQHRYLGTSTYLASTPVKDTKAFQKFKLKQAKMQRDNNVPVYLKAGFRDKVLFNVSLGVFSINLIWIFCTIRDFIKNY